MARTPLYTSISTSGPFFRNQPGATFRANARSMLRAMAIEGQDDIKGQLAAGEAKRAIISNGVQPTRVREHVTAGVPFTPTTGKRATVFGGNIIVNIYIPNWGYTPEQGRALMAAYGGLARKTGAFARTARRLRSARAINVAELLRNIA